MNDINKDMEKHWVTLEILEPGKPIPFGLKKDSGNIVFDVIIYFRVKQDG